MNNNKNELLKFLGGLALLVVGLFLLFNRVHVGSTGFDWGRMSFGRFSFPSGLIVVPFIIGIVWMFGSGGSFVSKIFTVLSILIIIAAIIANIRRLIYPDTVSLCVRFAMLTTIPSGAGDTSSVTQLITA